MKTTKTQEAPRARYITATSALCAAVLSLPALAQSQEINWQHPDGTVHFYRAVPVAAGITWAEANAAAARAGGYLATITSDTENALVRSLIGESAFWSQDPNTKAWNGPWIGGAQAAGGAEPAGGWGWAELEPFGYQNWTPGQPDNAGAADRIHFGGGSALVDTWADAPAATKLSGYVIEASGPTVPRTLGLLYRERGSFDGYTLISPMSAKNTWLVDPRGRVVHTWTSQYAPGQSAYLLPNGNLLRCGKVTKPSTPSGGDGGIVEEFDWDNNLVWSYTLSTSTEILHHDIARMPNGNTLMLVWDFKTSQEAIAAGRDPNLLKDGHLWPDKIIEVKPTGKTTGTTVWQWHPFDHLVQDYDSTKANYGDPAKHPELIDINYAPNPIGDWMHSNAIDYNPKLDQIVISVRSFDEFWIIDHSTTTAEAAGHTGGRSGMGGDLLYRWGNPLAYRAGTSKDQRLFKQHDVHWIPDGLPGAGNILVFSNGQGRPEGSYSTVDELVLPAVDSKANYPMAGSVWGPAAAFWSYKAPVPTTFYSEFVSGAQRLPNGNTLVCGGWLGRVREVDSKGTALWEYFNPVAADVSGTQGDVIGTRVNGVFRAPRYAPDHPALKGRNLVPGEPLEKHAAVLLQDGSTAPHIAKVGTPVALSLRTGHLPGQIYLLATSATQGLIPVDNRFVRMGWDAVLEASVLGAAPEIFQGYAGVLDNSGRGNARLVVPNIPALKGLKVYTTMLVAHPLAPTGIGMISNTLEFEIDA